MKPTEELVDVLIAYLRQKEKLPCEETFRRASNSPIRVTAPGERAVDETYHAWSTPCKILGEAKVSLDFS